jgi:GcvH upstream region-like protein
MLRVFRKYQKFVFIFVIAILVTTFAFFGTYQAIAPAFGRKSREGDERSYEKEMARFLQSEQWMFSRKIFDSNFLNDGVISNDFLENGMAEIVVSKFPDKFRELFFSKLEKEKLYRPYVHPHISTLSAESLWSIFSPDIPLKLKCLQQGNGSFKDRKDLFLAQKTFPPAFFSQMIRYHEQNYPQNHADPRLARDDIALFGYHDINDWFGESFVETLADLIVRMAAYARKTGYKVTKNEVLYDLVSRSQEVFQGLKQKINLPVEDGYGLFQLYLTQNGWSEDIVLKIWEDVTLFRRLIQDVRSCAIVDPLPLTQFYQYAFENATIEVFQMAPDLRLRTEVDLKKLEAYLAAVSEHRLSPLDISENYASITDVRERAPELVAKRFRLLVTHISKKSLEAKVSVRQMIHWESEPENWVLLQNQFPELVQKSGEPLAILESLEAKTRKLVDQFACKQIVESHPEWINEALLSSETHEKELFLGRSTHKPFEGVKDAGELLEIFENRDEIAGYTQDNANFFRFQVLERGDLEEIIPYKLALKSGILDRLIETMESDKLVKQVIEACPDAYRSHPYAFRFAKLMGLSRDGHVQGNLSGQFSIERKEKTLTRSSSADFISFDEALAQANKGFSEIRIDPMEGPYFFRLVDQKLDHTIPLNKLIKTQELLGDEVGCIYFEKLLEEIL